MNIRQCRSNLYFSGLGVIAFGAWSVIKLIMFLILKPSAIFDSADEIMSNRTLFVFVMIFLFIVVAIDLAIRLYVGISSIKAGGGKKKGPAYIVFAILLIISSLVSIVFMILFPDSSSVTDLIASFLVECTSLFALCDLSVSAIWLRRLENLPEV